MLDKSLSKIRNYMTKWETFKDWCQSLLYNKNKRWFYE
jgi:hypothetical protein